jgi:branched-chain amino acid transport system substrate-binding protein
MKKYNAEIQLYAPYLYDAVMVMADSMKRANSVEPAKYLPEVGKTKHDGVTALIEFDEKGDLKGGAISLYRYQGGKLEYVETLGGGVGDAVKQAAAATGEAAKAVAGAAADATKDAVKAGADAVKDAADATKAAVEKK